ncbi:hypothetical protein EX895_004673 [Sporisorium graminicola]|uniref:Uncharacterized protein n=1 Tax=Sporisorium graminicola TaxID=280036 RepID=A0A4U7KQ78_9BASI|nr:hypothetical protein EX895_004673 [Sporisorium graminicola]TKY86524.1 hypothetical protein EX895_004673 [Sporisorium graminicola]
MSFSSTVDRPPVHERLTMVCRELAHPGSLAYSQNNMLGVSRPHPPGRPRHPTIIEKDSRDNRIHFPRHLQTAASPSFDPSTPATATASVRCSSPAKASHLSPLSMLFEGILADFASPVTTSSSCRDDDNPFPYSPVSGDSSWSCSFSVRAASFHTASPGGEDERGYAVLKSQASSPCSTEGSFVGTPESSPFTTGALLDQTLAELVGRDAMGQSARVSVISQTRPLLGAEKEEAGLLFKPLRVGVVEGEGVSRPRRRHPVQQRCQPVHDLGGKDVDTSRPNPTDSLIDPHLATARHSGFSTNWNPTPPGSPHPTQAFDTATATLPSRPPPRPPRPPHCLDSLEDLLPFPSLRSVRKSPAEYLRPKRSSSHRSNREVEFKLGPVPARAARQVVAAAASAPALKVTNQRNTIEHMMAIISADPELDTFDSALQSESTRQTRSTAAAVEAVAVPGVYKRAEEQDNAIEVLHDYFPPSYKHKEVSHRPTFQTTARSQPHPARPLHLPTAAEVSPQQQAQRRKPSLMRKISHTMQRSPSRSGTPTAGATDYSKTRMSFAVHLRARDVPGRVSPFPAAPSSAPLARCSPYDGLPVVIISAQSDIDNNNNNNNNSSSGSSGSGVSGVSRLKSFSSAAAYPPSTSLTRHRAGTLASPLCMCASQSPSSTGTTTACEAPHKSNLECKPSLTGSVHSSATAHTTPSAWSCASGASGSSNGGRGGIGAHGILISRKPSRVAIVGSAARCIDELLMSGASGGGGGVGSKKVSFGAVSEVR